MTKTATSIIAADGRDPLKDEDLLREFFENNTDALSVVAVASRRRFQILAINPACAKVLGVERAAAVGRFIDEVIPPETTRPITAQFLRCLRAGKAIEWEAEFSSGNPGRSYSTTFVPLRDKFGHIYRIMAISRDITERRRLEEKARQLLRAVEQSPVSIIITETSGNIQYVNPKFTEVSGYTAAEVLNQNPRLLKSGTQTREQYQELWTTISSGREWRGEFHNRRKNGDYYWESALIGPILDSSGTVTHFLAVKEDITARKQLEAQLRQSQKIEAVGRLAGGIAHDFNNILTVIIGNATLLQLDAVEEPDRPARIAAISKAAERAAHLTRQLLTFSRREACQLKPLDLDEVVADTAQMLQRLIGEHIQLQTCCAPGLARVLGDRNMLEQVLVNLAVNSRDAMPSGGKLTIQTRKITITPLEVQHNAKARPGEFIRLTATDTGCGILPEHLDRIFEPFFTTKDVGKGTGLGLATVFGIVEQHQGWIQVESRVGAGTTFHIFLPRVGPVRTAKADRNPMALVRGGTETILLVEDEAALRTLLRGFLERHGYRIREAPSAIAALEVWSEHCQEIDLLLTDMVMPGGMSGRELGTRLQAEKPGLKVIYSTGYTDEMLGEDSALRDTRDFLEKPYNLVEVLRKIRMCLEAH